MRYSTTPGWDLTFFFTVITINTKIFTQGNITNENNKEHNRKWPHILDRPYKILIIGSGSGKTNALLNLIKEQDDIDEICLYAKDLIEPKYEFFD